MSIQREIQRRRTFAIIAHPDAGKTTLTEKLLLYGGAVQLAGSVTARKNQRSTTSDWMELERQRGISVNSTVLQFDYGPYCVNLLDTPGHNDFSEDTYRVLMAVDAAVMVIDAGKGIEGQTRKLFEVCRLKNLPIFTFMNKCDRPTREPLDLLDEIENTLQIGTCALNWPAGTGPDFRGVYDRLGKRVHLFERAAGGARRADVQVHDLDDPTLAEIVEEPRFSKFREELGLLEDAGSRFDPKAVLEGHQTPVFFGSAVNNFGVQLLLDAFLEHAPPPGPRESSAGPVDPASAPFSGFIFKIQSNMDPRHRDRIAFLRVCSGRFTRDMSVVHSRTGRTVRLSSSHKLFARERNTVDVAYPGDVIGIVGHDGFGIGDTLTEDPRLVYRAIPRFAPECFAFLQSPSTAQFKRFRAGLEDLLREGLAQPFMLKDAQQRVPLLGAVGPLQFEVLQYRLKQEYGAEARIESAPWTSIRWVEPDAAGLLGEATLPSGCRPAEDEFGQPVLLFKDDWGADYFMDRNPKIRLQRRPRTMETAQPPP